MTIQVIDEDYAVGGAQDTGPGDTITVTLVSDDDAVGCTVTAGEIADTGVFQVEFGIVDTLAASNLAAPGVCSTFTALDGVITASDPLVFALDDSDVKAWSRRRPMASTWSMD